MNYVISNGIKFVAIENLENRCCYHVAVLQLLHTSKTFNSIMSSTSIPKEFEVMMKPFKEYAIVNETTQQRVRDAYKELAKIMNDDVKHGYSSHLFMYYYLLPLINKLFPNKFETICNEVRADPIFFNEPKDKSSMVYRAYPFLKDNSVYEEMHDEMINRYMKGELDIRQDSLIGAIIEIFPSAHTVDGGHALFLLKDGRTYYVFDDNTTIDLLERYIRNRNNNIAKLCIYSNDKASIKEIQQLWGSNAMTARVNNRWEITENVEDVVVPLYRFLHVGNMPELTGGADEKDYKKPFIISLICLIILTIIVIIEVIIVLRKRQQRYCPCKNKR